MLGLLYKDSRAEDNHHERNQKSISTSLKFSIMSKIQTDRRVHKVSTRVLDKTRDRSTSYVTRQV